MPVSAAATVVIIAPLAAAEEPSSVAFGQALWCTEPSCHHDQTSSVT